MKTYELTYIISPEISLQEAVATAKDIESSIQSNEGLILKQESPVAKTLSYPIKKHASGFVGTIEFHLEPEKLSELQTKLQKDGKIVRHMVIIKEAVKAKKQRRTRSTVATSAAPEEKLAPVQETPVATKEDKTKEKVELKDIEQRLDEILGQ